MQVSIAYDTFYSGIKEADRSLMWTKISDNAIKPGLEVYQLGELGAAPF